ncbi:SET domain-containing protein [Rickenella mellea]|uniref:SET domain-containing protein n=1 Tax=Rickenella mellea TaxID=50990 RepID=A0A4Y7PX33_9AGAM|nr:SET domain-containing protein [Rickenella mellea]
MSFGNIRAARDSRQRKSYVLPSSDSKEYTGISQASRDGVRAPDQNSGTNDEQTQTGSGSSSQHALSAPPDTNARPIPRDGLYRELPPSLSLKSTKHAGRGIWSDENIKAGTEIIALRPRIHVLSTQHLESFCSYCCTPRPSSGLKRCTKCHALWYCGPACQKVDWNVHKYECTAISHWKESAPKSNDLSIAIPSEAVRSLGRVLWTRKAEGSNSVWWKEIDAMQSHRGSLPPSATDSHVQLAHFLVRYLGVRGPGELSSFGLHSAAELVDLISKFTTNTFTLTTPSVSPIGVTISPLVALINHSCDPNASIVFPRSSPPNENAIKEPVLRVVALRDIPPGTEILTTYIDITLSTAKRREALLETYNFTCNCSACSPPPDVPKTTDWREVFWCPRKCGGTCTLPNTAVDIVKCTKCNKIVADVEPILDAVRVGEEALEKASSLQLSDPEHVLRLTKNIIPILTSMGLTASTHPLLALFRLRQSLLISSLPSDPTKELLDEAIRVAAKSVAGLSNILREGHPIRAIALAELGKLLAVDEPPSPSTTAIRQPELEAFPPTGEARLSLAKETLQRALGELHIAFGVKGEGGEVGKEVRNMLVDIERELGVWKTKVRGAVEDAILESRAKAVSGGKS